MLPGTHKDQLFTILFERERQRSCVGLYPTFEEAGKEALRLEREHGASKEWRVVRVYHSRGTTREMGRVQMMRRF